MSGRDKAEAYYHLLEAIGDEHELEYNPAPGPKWQAVNGILRMPNLNATEMSVMSCLIDLAHEEHGFAFPSRETVQAWTGRSKSAVDRALSELKRLGLIQGTERRHSYTKSETTLYVITWQPFFTAFRRVEAWKLGRRHGDVMRNATVEVVPEIGPGWSPKSGQVVPENGEHISLTYLSKDNLSRSPCGDPLKDFSDSFFFDGVTQRRSERVETQNAATNDVMHGIKFWHERLRRLETDLQTCAEPEERKRLVKDIADYRKRIEDLENEQRTKARAGRR